MWKRGMILFLLFCLYLSLLRVSVEVIPETPSSGEDFTAAFPYANRLPEIFAAGGLLCASLRAMFPPRFLLGRLRRLRG